MKSVGHPYLKISWLQGFRVLTSGDLRWPLTSTKNNRVLPLNMANLYTKYEKCQSLLSRDIVFTNRLRGFRSLTSGDLRWPLTSTKNNRVLPLNMTNLCTTYEMCRSSISRDTMFTSCLRGFRSLTSGDLRWPLTSTKNDRVLPFNMTNLYRLFLSWYIMISRFTVFALWWPQMTFDLH